MGHIKTKMSEHNTITIKGCNNSQEPQKRVFSTFRDSLIMICIKSRLPASNESGGMNQ